MNKKTLPLYELRLVGGEIRDDGDDDYHPSDTWKSGLVDPQDVVVEFLNEQSDNIFSAIGEHVIDYVSSSNNMFQVEIRELHSITEQPIGEWEVFDVEVEYTPTFFVSQ